MKEDVSVWSALETALGPIPLLWCCICGTSFDLYAPVSPTWYGASFLSLYLALYLASRLSSLTLIYRPSPISDFEKEAITHRVSGVMMGEVGWYLSQLQKKTFLSLVTSE